MKSFPCLLFLFLVLGLPGEAFPADPAAGREKARPCFACHGEDGNSANPRYPKLAGQLAGYIFKQTLDFKEGRRKDEIMSTMIQIIPGRKDLEDIAAYFAAQPVMKGRSVNYKSAKRGRRLFRNERCVYCHEEGAKPVGPFVPGAPVIGGQHKAYLIKAMQDIRSGRRKGDIYDLMYKTLNRLSAKDIEDIAEFLSGL